MLSGTHETNASARNIHTDHLSQGASFEVGGRRYVTSALPQYKPVSQSSHAADLDPKKFRGEDCRNNRIGYIYY